MRKANEVGEVEVVVDKECREGVNRASGWCKSGGGILQLILGSCITTNALSLSFGASSDWSAGM